MCMVHRTHICQLRQIWGTGEPVGLSNKRRSSLVWVKHLWKLYFVRVGQSCSVMSS